MGKKQKKEPPYMVYDSGKPLSENDTRKVVLSITKGYALPQGITIRHYTPFYARRGFSYIDHFMHFSLINGMYEKLKASQDVNNVNVYQDLERINDFHKLLDGNP